MTKQTTAIVPAVKELPTGPTRPFVEQVRLHWRQSFQAILATGRALVEARKALGEADFKKMIEEELPFGRSTASMLMLVAMDERIAKFQHVEIWPPSWGTLYELTHIKKDEDFYQAITDGRIRPDMEREEAKRLVKHPGSPAVRRQKGGRGSVEGDADAKSPDPSPQPTKRTSFSIALSFTAGEWTLIREVMSAADQAGMVERIAEEIWPEDQSGWKTDPPDMRGLAQKLGLVEAFDFAAIGDDAIEGEILPATGTDR